MTAHLLLDENTAMFPSSTLTFSSIPKDWQFTEPPPPSRSPTPPSLVPTTHLQNYCTNAELTIVPSSPSGPPSPHLFSSGLKAPTCSVALSCPTPCDPTDCSPPGSSVHGDSPGKKTGVGCHALLQGIFPTQGWNLGLPHCRQILYRPSHQASLHTR